MHDGRKKTLHLNGDKRPRKRKLVGHEAWLDEMKGKDIAIRKAHVGGDLICKLVDFDKYAVIVRQRHLRLLTPEYDEPFVVFKHDISSMRKVNDSEIS